MLPQSELSRPRVPTGGIGSHAVEGAGSTRSAVVETSAYLHQPASHVDVDEAWLAAASWYEEAMAQLVLRQPGAVERVRAAAQALQALTVAQAVFGPDDIAA